MIPALAALCALSIRISRTFFARLIQGPVLLKTNSRVLSIARSPAAYKIRRFLRTCGSLLPLVKQEQFLGSSASQVKTNQMVSIQYLIIP